MANHPNRSTGYTVRDRHGNVLGEGETLESAALIVLGYDSHEHEIWSASDGYELWTSTNSRASSAYRGLTKSVISSRAAGLQVAHSDIYRQVIRNADRWSGLSVCTDAEYAAELADIAAQNDAT